MGEFPRCRFTEQNASGGGELLRHHGILRRDVIGQQLGLRRGPDPGGFDDILEAVRDAVQRAARAIGAAGIAWPKEMVAVFTRPPQLRQ